MIDLPHRIQQLLSLGPKHPVRDELKEADFLADIDIFFAYPKHRKVPGEALCEIEDAAKAYSKWLNHTPSDKGIEKARIYLRETG